MYTLKLTPIGDSVGVILPKEVLERLKLEEGDTVFLTESPEGLQLTPHDPTVENQMKLARSIMRERHTVLKELAR